MLLDLVLTELLAWIEPDQDCAGGLVRVEDDGRAASAGGLDLVKIPGAHGRDPTRALRM